MKRNNRQALFSLLLATIPLLVVGCEASLAPSSASMSVTPSSLEVKGGTAGDDTFGVFVVEILNDKASPIPDIDVQITSSLLRVLNNEGVLEEPGTAVTIPTDENGLVYVTVEVPLAEAFVDTLQITSGAVTAGAIVITGTADSSDL